MKKADDNFDSLIKKVATMVDKSPEQLQPIFKILKDNWYDSQNALKKLKLPDYQRMKIPHRIAQILCQLLSDSPPNGSPLQQKKSISGSQTKLDQMSMLNLSKSLQVKLLGNHYNNQFQTRSILEIIYKLMANIVKYPHQMKYRILKKSNSLIQKNIIQEQPCLEFLNAIGFVDCGQTLQLLKNDTPQIVFLEDSINHMIIQLGGKNMANQSSIQSPKHQHQQNMFLTSTKFPNQQTEVKQQFTPEKLSEMKYMDALEQLVNLRNKIMAEPPKNRRLRICNIKLQMKNIAMNQVSFEEQFSKSNDQLISKYWKQMITNNARSQKFQSKRKIQFEFLIKQKIYKETLIKIKLPNQLVIEAYFGPMEILSDVLFFVSQIVIGDLYLFTAPPKKIMGEKQMVKNLIELDSVPMGSFYLSAKDNQYYIQNEYVGCIQK